MAIIADKLPLQLVPIRPAKLIQLFILTLVGSLLPFAGFAVENSRTVNDLKQKAQHAYIEGRYADAAAINKEIAEKHPESEARRYAVQMLGTIYENNIVDIRKAIRWDREYLKKYADPRQVSFYREKLSALGKRLRQGEEFQKYRSVLSCNDRAGIIVSKVMASL